MKLPSVQHEERLPKLSSFVSQFSFEEKLKMSFGQNYRVHVEYSK